MVDDYLAIDILFVHYRVDTTVDKGYTQSMATGTNYRIVAESIPFEGARFSVLLDGGVVASFPTLDEAESYHNPNDCDEDCGDYDPRTKGFLCGPCQAAVTTCPACECVYVADPEAPGCYECNETMCATDYHMPEDGVQGTWNDMTQSYLCEGCTSTVRRCLCGPYYVADSNAGCPKCGSLFEAELTMSDMTDALRIK